MMDTMRLLGRPHRPARSHRPALAPLVTSTLVSSTLLVGSLPAANAQEPPRRPVALAPVAAGLEERVLPVADTPEVSSWETETFTMLGATWPDATGPGRAEFTVEFSSGAGGGWGPWQELEEMVDVPDANAEGTARRGSDLVWVGATHRLRIRTRGDVPQDLQVTLLDTRGTVRGPRAGALPQGTPAATRKEKPDHAPRPDIRGRKAWGANEKWRTSDPVLRRTTQQVHVHHTASSNSYRRADVAGILRGFYRYHTKSLGWSDIGYNVLVDRFGRAWLGRYGGPMVQGAHTLGFNHNSVGIAVIGDHRATKPRRPVVRTVVRVAAWHLDRQGRRATGKVKVTSKGSDRYADGTTVRLPVITGHRRTNHTACPGRQLMKRLPEVREWTQRRIDRF